MLLVLRCGKRGFQVGFYLLLGSCVGFFSLQSPYWVSLKILNLVIGGNGNMAICRLDGLGIALGKTVFKKQIIALCDLIRLVLI